MAANGMDRSRCKTLLADLSKSEHTDNRQDPRAYDAYEEQLFIAPGQVVPDLISTMTNEQWLDAMSAPRIDPTNPRPRHISMPNQNSEPSDSEDSDGEIGDDEDGSEWETDDDEGGEEGEEAAHSGDDKDGEKAP